MDENVDNKKKQELVTEYFKLKYLNRIDAIIKLQNCADKEAINQINKDNPVTKNYIINELKKQDIDYVESLKEFNKIHKDYVKYFDQYYNHDRANFFKDPKELLKWFSDQNDRCGYCDITSKQLKEVIEIREKDTGYNTLTLNGKKKRSKGTLEIERKNPDLKEFNGYTHENCILSCPLCNNAKSNLIDEDGWETYFVKPMKAYYQSILNKT